MNVAFAFLLSRAVVYTFFYLAPLFMPESAAAQGRQRGFPPLIEGGLRWDYLWYSDIVKEGYHLGEPGGEANVAFWPLYPLLVKVATMLAEEAKMDLAGLLISNLAFFIALYYLYNLIRIDFPRDIASRTVLYLTFFPTSFFFSAFYQESLLILGIVGAFYYQLRGRRIQAGLFGAAAALSHPSGALLVLPLALEDALEGRLGRQTLWLVLVPLGALAFPAYLYLKLGDPTAFLAASGGSWGHTLAWPWDTLGRALWLITENPWIDTGFLVSAVATFSFLAITIVSIPNQRLSFTLWALTLFGLYLSLPARVPLDSMSRYALAFFPVFVTLAHWGSSRLVNIAILTIFLPLLALLSAMFSRWYWVA